MPTPRIYYKIGDTLYLSGAMTGDNLPALPWTGAAAAMNIRMKDGTLVVDHAAVTLTVATGAYVYNGGTSAITQAGEYEYEIEVTFQDGSKLTFPNDEQAPLTALKQIA